MSTPIVLPTYEVDGWTGSVTDEDGVAWWVHQNDVTGWDSSPAVRLAHTDRKSGHGAYRGGRNYRTSRTVTIPGYAKGADAVTIDAARARFAALLSDGGQHTLTVTERDGSQYTCDVELADDPKVARTGYAEFDYQLALIAVDPRKHGAWDSATAHLPLDPPGGLDATTAGGLDATTAGGLDAGGVGASGLLSIRNDGTETAYPLITFSGNGTPLSSPLLVDVDTGESIQYAGTLSDVDTVVINADEFAAQGYPARSVLLNGTADRGNLLALLGDWPSVEPGETKTWVFRATTNNPNSTATVALRPAYW